MTVDPALTITCVPAQEALDQHGAPWRALADRVPQATVFMLPVCVDTWMQTLADGLNPVVLLAHHGPQLVGVLPIIRATVRRGPAFAPRIDYLPQDQKLAPGQRRLFPVRQLSSIVSWPATSIRPTLLVDPTHQTGVIHGFASHMAAQTKVDQIVVPAYAGAQAQAWEHALRAAGLAPWIQPLGRRVLTTETLRPFDAIVADRNRNFRRNVKRARNVARQAGLEFETHAGHATARAALPDLAELAAQSWKAAGITETRVAIPFKGDQHRYFDSILSRADPSITPVVILSRCAGATVSGCLSFLHGHTITGMIIFHNNRLPKASPGLLTLDPLIRWALDRGAVRMDLNATQDWLRHMADTNTEFVNVLAFRPTLRGRAYGLIRSAVARLRRYRVSSF